MTVWTDNFVTFYPGARQSIKFIENPNLSWKIKDCTEALLIER